MTKLEHAKAKVELLSVQAALANFELQIMQREDEIEKLKTNLAIQQAKEVELKQKLSEPVTAT